MLTLWSPMGPHERSLLPFKYTRPSHFDIPAVTLTRQVTDQTLFQVLALFQVSHVKHLDCLTKLSRKSKKLSYKTDRLG